jgi:hypothetical protein
MDDFSLNRRKKNKKNERFTKTILKNTEDLIKIVRN